MAGCWPGNTIRYRDALSELITNMSQQQMLVAGCSHTAGVGIDINFGWATVLSRQLNLKLVNLARNGACARYVADVLIDWLARTSTQPALVVVQWPNPYRSMQLINQQPHFYNVNHMDEDFAQRLRLCPESFVNEWRQAVIDLNQRCQCDIINICLESLDRDVVAPAQDLLDLGITVHLDEKKPGLTWHFDSAATDGNHHSEQCHQKWADRILTLVKNAV